MTGYTRWVLDETDPFPTGYTVGDIWAPQPDLSRRPDRQSEDTVSQFIDGRRCDAAERPADVVLDPSTGEVVAEITLAGAEDVDQAVQAARRRTRAWSRATPAERSAHAGPVRAAARRPGRGDRAAGKPQAGKPIRLAREFDVPGTIDNVDFFAGAARNLEGKATAEYSADHTSSIRREPIGVVGSISPWNYPLQMAAWKILPAIAAGNTIVLKPAEITPLTSLLFAEIASEAGLPDGVVNVITGDGPDCGAVAAAPSRGRRWSRSPARRRWAGRCWRRRPPPPSGSTSSWAARRRSWSSTTPTSTRPSTARSPAA